MRKKNIILSVLLSVSVLVTGLGINPIFAFASSQNFIEPYSIGSATVYLEKKSTSSLSYRVTTNTNDGISSSVTVKIVLQKNESNKWVNKETISKTEKNVLRFDVTDTIKLKIV